MQFGQRLSILAWRVDVSTHEIIWSTPGQELYDRALNFDVAPRISRSIPAWHKSQNKSLTEERVRQFMYQRIYNR